MVISLAFGKPSAASAPLSPLGKGRNQVFPLVVAPKYTAASTLRRPVGPFASRRTALRTVRKGPKPPLGSGSVDFYSGSVGNPRSKCPLGQFTEPKPHRVKPNSLFRFGFGPAEDRLKSRFAGAVSHLERGQRAPPSASQRLDYRVKRRYQQNRFILERCADVKPNCVYLWSFRVFPLAFPLLS